MCPEDRDGAIEADPAVRGEDEDSTFGEGESRLDSTASITSSLLKYRELHGRTYQTSKTTEYWAPNDERQLEAFDVGHQMLTMMMGDKLTIAPIAKDVKNVLDVGTGTGIWAMDFADEHPDTEVVGIDITPTQSSWVPPNVRFEIEDAQLDWTFKPETFDFIHLRYMHGSFTDWDKLFEEMYKALKPGGWFQHLEPDIEMVSEHPDVEIGEDHIYKQWARAFYDAGDKLNRTFRVTEQMESWPTKAGFTNIEHKVFKLPLNPWPKDKNLKAQGAYTGLYLDLSLEGFANFPLGEILGWPQEQVHVLVANYRTAVRDPKLRGIGNIHVVYGQKPLAAE